VPGTWAFTWFPPGVDPDNPGTGAFPLTASPYRNIRLGSLLGATGPNFTPVTQSVPFQPGSLLKFIDVPDAEIDMRVIFSDIQESYLWQHLAAAAPYFTPTKGLGWLQIQNPSGNTKCIQCTCISGLNIDPSSYTFTSVDADLRFLAPYPYWLDAIPQTDGTADAPIFIWQVGTNDFFKILPGFINFTDAKIYTFTATNNGDVNSNDFEMIFNGPLTNLKITNQTLGGTESDQVQIYQRGTLFMKDYNLSVNSEGVGTRLTINFKNQTIVEGVKNPINRIRYLTSNSTFFPLLPGDNVIRVSINDGNDQTKLRSTWRSTYSTMY
jgi:hypothetical protein